jgi:hypothetical protein
MAHLRAWKPRETGGINFAPYMLTGAGKKWGALLFLLILAFMRFTDFKLLPLPVQAHIICEKGVLLCERREDEYLIALYAVDEFYVEIYYRGRNEEIEKFRSFHSTELLEPYLNTIRFVELVA